MSTLQVPTFDILVHSMFVTQKVSSVNLSFKIVPGLILSAIFKFMFMYNDFFVCYQEVVRT